MREVLSDNAHPGLSRHTPPAQQISQHAMWQKMGNDSMNKQTSRQMQQTNKYHLLISLGEAESSAGLIVPLIDARGEAGVADGCAVLPHKPDAHCHAH